MIGYARVSTADQKLDLQLDSLRAAGCSVIFAEHVSGGADYRPAFAAMVQHVREGDTVVVHAMDRLGRKLVEILNTLELFERTGVHFQSISEHLNTRGPHNKIVMHVLLAVAELLRNLGRERTRDGLKAAAARGNKGGRPLLLTDATRDHILHLHSKEHSLRQIAATAGVSKSTAHRAIEDARQLEMYDR